jgi:hypothetical protein
LKEEALDGNKWRNRFGRGCGPVVWQITDEWMNEYNHYCFLFSPTCSGQYMAIYNNEIYMYIVL